MGGVLYTSCWKSWWMIMILTDAESYSDQSRSGVCGLCDSHHSNDPEWSEMHEIRKRGPGGRPAYSYTDTLENVSTNTVLNHLELSETCSMMSVWADHRWA